MKIKRIGVLSAGKIGGVLYALLGLILGVFFAVFYLIFAAAGLASEDTMGLAVGGFVGAAASIVLLPIFYGVLGFVGGVVSAFLYNVVARFVVGIEIEVEQSYAPEAGSGGTYGPEGR